MWVYAALQAADRVYAALETAERMTLGAIALQTTVLAHSLKGTIGPPAWTQPARSRSPRTTTIDHASHEPLAAVLLEAGRDVDDGRLRAALPGPHADGVRRPRGVPGGDEDDVPRAR